MLYFLEHSHIYQNLYDSHHGIAATDRGHWLRWIPGEDGSQMLAHALDIHILPIIILPHIFVYQICLLHISR